MLQTNGDEYFRVSYLLKELARLQKAMYTKYSWIYEAKRLYKSSEVAEIVWGCRRGYVSTW
jgi:hypothetical protein